MSEAGVDPRDSATAGGDDATAADEQAQQDGSSEGLDPRAALEAAVDLAGAAREFVAALGALLVSELRLARAATARLAWLGLWLVAVGVSLWATSVALLGWALFLLTGSPAAALGLLLLLHLATVFAIVYFAKRTARHVGLPETRAEVRALLDRASGE